MEGWNRVDEFNILANPYTTTRPAVHARRHQAVHPGERAVYRQVPARRSHHEIRLWRRAADVRHVFHQPQHPRGARRDRADRKRHRRQPRPAREHLHARLAALRHRPRPMGGRRSSVFPAERTRTAFGGWSAASTRISHRAYQQKDIAKGFDDLCSLERPPVFNTGGGFPIIPSQGVYAPKDNMYWSDIRYKDRTVRILRRRHVQRHGPFQPDRGSALLQLQAGQGPDLRRLVRPLWPTRPTRGQCRIGKELDVRRCRPALHRELQARRLDDDQRPGVQGLPTRRD